MVDALALEDDEGRDERRYASGRSKYPEIRGFPNGATQPLRLSSNGRQRSELKHLSNCRKRKQLAILGVVANETGTALVPLRVTNL